MNDSLLATSFPVYSFTKTLYIFFRIALYLVWTNWIYFAQYIYREIVSIDLLMSPTVYWTMIVLHWLQFGFTILIKMMIILTR